MALKLRGDTWYAYFSYRERQADGSSKVKKEWISLECKKKDTRLRDIRYGKLLEFREGKGKKDGSADFEIFKLSCLARIKGTRKGNTYKISKRAFAMLASFRLIKQLKDLTPAVLQGFQDWMKTNGVGNVTNNRYIRELKREMLRAELEELIAMQPWKKVHYLPEPQREVEPFSKKEIQQMLSCNAQDTGTFLPLWMWQAFVAFGVYVGPRRGEISHLLKKDIKLSRGIIGFHGHKKDPEKGILENWEIKAYQERDVDINPNLIPYLKKLLSNEPDCPYLFCRKGRPIKEDYWTAKFVVFARKAGLASANPHRLRHTFGTFLGENAGAGTIKKAMGHKKLSTSDRYVHRGDVKKAIFDLSFEPDSTNS